ncbi:hypothetical protein [Luteimonas salinilitoris]|uniref:Peptidase S8/S53 domain-containing protein n=1 Tax=Luteimonas salinilitoris TaxID=3237697 RepID=A0ABV4HVM5_9GAMM
MRVIATLLALLAVSSTAGAASLSAHDREQFVLAHLATEASEPVDVEFLALAGRFDELEAGLVAIGAQIEFADRKVGYVRAGVPRQQLLMALSLRVLQSAALPASYPKERVAPEARRLTDVPDIRLPIPKVSTTPLTPDGPYYPLAETGMLDFWRALPAADGRGVVIGFVDDGFDLLHPAIQRVHVPGGGLAPKVIDMVPLSAPDRDDSWVSFGEPQVAATGELSFAGAQWRVPGTGPYRGGIFAVRLALGSPIDPETQENAFILSVGALWDPATGRIWIDTDGDRDFSNNRALRDYAVAQEIDWFGRADGEEDHRIPFGVKIDTVRGAAWLSLDGSMHGTWTGSAASGNRLTLGLYDAPAPNARLIDLRSRAQPETLVLPAILSAAARPDIDIVNYSGGLGRPLPSGQEDFARLVVSRAVTVYGKPILAASSGLPGTISVWDYWNAEMIRRNAQLPPPHREAMTSRVLFAEDGTVNDLLAPSVTMPAVSRYIQLFSVGADGRRYVLPGRWSSPAPDGYAIGANPSCTIGYASGVLASLLSAARQQGVRYDLARLTNALFTGAKPVPGFPAQTQGHGLIRIDRAWQQLVAMAEADDPDHPVLTHFELLDAQGSKVQGYAEKFAVAGAPAERSLQVIRRGGRAGDRAYRLELATDDDKAFELAQARVVLPRDRAVRIDFTVRPSANHYVAFVQVIDDSTGAVMQKIPLHTQAPDRMETLAPGVKRYRSSIPSHRTQRHVLELDAGVQAVRAAIEMPKFVGGEEMYALASSDRSWEVSRYARPGNGTPPPDGMDLFTRATVPGTVDLLWENRGRREYESAYDPPAPDGPIDAALTLTHYAVSFERESETTLKLHNHLADVTGRVEWLTGIPSSHVLQPDGKASPRFVAMTLAVPDKTALLRVRVTGKDDDRAPVHVYVMDATGKASRIVKQVALKDGRAELTLASPTAGTWRLAVWAHDGDGGSYDVETVALSTQDTDGGFVRYLHGSRTPMPVAYAPAGQAMYAALWVEPAGDDEAGVVIGLTPLSAAAF